MSEKTAIRLENLSKTFGRGEKAVQAVVNLNLEIQAGLIFGFLGPNGAGKTTTIRLLVDLIRPTKGAAFIYGQDVRRNPGVLRRVGALVEDATFYGYLNGRDNLEVLARTAGNYRPKRIEALLEQVGLAGEANRRASGYSTGMKQRLGIAGALLGDPELMILDEPTNGLDPGGRQEMRAFIRGLAKQAGVTVFLSSHLLHEVEQVCDRVAIINHGEIVREGAVSALLAEGQAQLRVQASPQESALQVLQETWEVSIDGEWLIVSAQPEEGHLLVERLVARDIQVHQVIVRKRTLEEYFIDATQESVIAQGIEGNREDTHV